MTPDLFAHLAARHDTSTGPATLSRRTLLRLTVASSAGLLLGAIPPLTSAAEAAPIPPRAFTPFLDIRPDGKVVVIVKHLDKGQGIATGLATLVAEELDADWAQVTTEFAPADTAAYKNNLFGIQGTGGSSSIANSFEQYRVAGATARAMLVAAAAAAWGVPARDVKVAKGVVSHADRKAGFGELAAAAAAQPVPDKPVLKSPAEFVLIGKTLPRVDTRPKSRGETIYTQDIRLPGMLTAVVAHPPKFGAVVKSFDAAKTKALKGVVDVVPFGKGVAVLANSTWAAIKGREALTVEWDESAAETRGTPELLAEYRRLAASPGTVFRNDGDAAAAMATAAKTIEAEYVFPFLAHATMEPMNAVVQIADGGATVWTGSQLQTVDQGVVAAIAAVPPEKVTINTLWAGGSFGRRAVPSSDYIAEATLIAKTHGKGLPIKLAWTREDDMKGGFYRPMAVHRVKAGIDASGAIVAWQHTIVSQSIIAGTPFEPALVKNGIDATVVEGVVDMPYAVANFTGHVHQPKIGVPPLWWRSVGHTHTAYVVETMIDELAAAAGKDPLAYRLDLLAKHPRHQGVLRLAAEKAGWGSPLPDGVKRGVAVHESFRSFVAEIAEVRMVSGKPKVVKVTAAVDCGLAVNPDIVRAQIEGGIGYGLGAVLHSRVTLAKGVVNEANFDSYEVLRLDEMPTLDVHIVASDAAPTGVGEPGTPPIGPAVANAVAQLTGRRVRVLPMDDGLRSG